jgi:DNA-binding transcriptional LysR family regulator
MKATIDLRQFRCAIALADERHFGRAARRVFLTQPGLSMLVARLERDLGRRLFDRDRRGVRLTPAGEAFVAEARRAVAQAERAVAQAARPALRVGHVPCADYTDFPARVRRFAAARPEVAMHLSSGLTAAAEADLLAGRVDVAFLYLPASVGLRVKPVWAEPLRLVGPADGLPRQVTPAALDGRPFVLFPPESAPHLAERLVRLWAEQGWRPGTVHRVEHPETALRMVAAGVGWTVLPAWVAKKLPAGLRAVPLPPPEVTAEVGLAWKPDSDRLVTDFIAAVG